MSTENDPQRWGNLSGDGSEGSPSTGLPGRPSLDDMIRSSIGGNPNSMNSMGSVSGGEKSSLLQKSLSE
ncbi:hypothetical protein V9T40_001061 [Parthenolecanium corni]|uniref:Uncharacterized protein n=1 Tax=Parthenolecanium corni TaxID=536013 RepID=A0AAN9TNJ5_9HEMI